MKLAITSQGNLISSKFCLEFENCKYIVIYDTVTKQYGSRKIPTFETNKQEQLIEFFKKIFIRHIITGKQIESKKLKIFIPSKKDITVEEAILDYLKHTKL